MGAAAIRVLHRFQRQRCVESVARRVAKIWSTEDALKKYLATHPKADPKKHSVKEQKEKKPEDPEAEDRKETAEDFKVYWKDTGDDAISKVIGTLSRGKAPTKKLLTQAKAQADSFKTGDHGLHGFEQKIIREMLKEIPLPTPKPKKPKPPAESSKTEAPKSPDAKPAESPKVEAPKTPESAVGKAPAPKPKKTPAKKTKGKAPQLVKPTKKGAGKGSDAITFQGSSDEVRKTYDKHAASTKLDWDDDFNSPISKILWDSDNDKHAEKDKRWTKDWVRESTDEGVAEFLTELHKPDSFARAKYEATQAVLRTKLEALKKRGLVDEDGYVKLYRGVQGPQAQSIRKGRGTDQEHDVDVQVRGLSSWSEDPTVANAFCSDQVILEQKVHISRIAVSWHAENEEWDSNTEREWVVIAPEDGNIKAKLHSHATLKGRDKPGEKWGYPKYDKKAA